MKSNIETSEYGSLIAKSTDLMSSKMDYHFKFLNLGWNSIDVDSSYLGYWFNQKTRQIISYCEGSVREYTSPNVIAFASELKSIRDFIKYDL